MFNRFDNGYQNMNNPNMNMDMNGYQTMPQNPYPTYNADPNIPYPTPPAQMSSPPTLNPSAYAHGGKVQRSRHNWAQKLRKMGTNGDTDLVHVNPLEKRMLKSMGGSGTINPKTGLRQYGFFSNPGKWLKSVVGPTGGTILGNMLLPGIGGIVGGALGGAAGSAIRGRKDFGQSALRGAGIGALAPTAAGLLGKGLGALGSPGTGAALTGYGEKNAIFPALDKLLGFGTKEAASGAATGLGAASVPMTFSANKNGSALENYNRHNGISGVSAGDDYEEEPKKSKKDKDFLDKLLGNTEDYLSKPKNLLALASVASSFANRPKKEKPKTPEQIADEQKRLEKALMLTPEERKAKEADLLAEARMRRSIARNQFLPEERLGNLDPLYRKSHTPEEQKRYGRWFSYYNNPDFSGEPLPFKKGGTVRSELVNKAKKLTAEIIEQNKNQNNGLLEEKSLIRAFSDLDKTLGLTSEEKDAVERYAENMFRDIQFTDGPGYFYNQAHGNPLVTKMRKGGLMGERIRENTNPLSGLIGGRDGGQADTIPAALPNNAYIVEASTLSDLGDGNTLAGADKVKALVSSGEYYISPEDVARFGKIGAKKLDRLVKNVRKHKRGGRTTLPPKAKSLANYLK